jgi:hypothetical protein
MKHRRVACACAGSIAFAFLIAELPGAPPADQTPVETSRRALDLLLASKYTEFTALLTADAKGRMTPEFLRDHVSTEIAGFGTLEEVGQPRTLKSGSSDIVSFPVRFSKNRVNVQFTLNEAGEVTGLNLRSPYDPLPQVWARPLYSKTELFQERDITVGTDEWKLAGKFTYPSGKGPFPAVILVHGPGPNDLDESIYATRIYADIA